MPASRLCMWIVANLDTVPSAQELHPFLVESINPGTGDVEEVE